jgi:hypothetical protein
MNSSAAAAAHKPHTHSVGFNLGAVAIFVAIGALGFAYLIQGAREVLKAPAPGGDVLVTRTLGANTLTIPAGWLADGGDQQPGFAKQVDLHVALPLGPDGALRDVDITLTQRSRVRPSAALLDGVYLHQFLPQQLSGPVGLIGKPLSPGEGYESETVWYDPITSSPFVAKCQAPLQEGVAGKCLRTVYLGSGIAAIYAFDDDVLGNWKKFDAELHPVLDRIGAL